MTPPKNISIIKQNPSNRVNQMRKKIIITGCSGFIGKALTQHLLNLDQYDIIGIDIKEPPLEFFKGSSYEGFHFNFISCDLSKEFNDNDIRVMYEKFHCQGLSFWENVTFIHLAANVGSSKFDTLENGYQNCIIDSNVMKMTGICSVDKFVFASSSEVYGSSKKPFSETSDFKVYNLPRGFYAANKINTEYVIQSKFENYLICRLFNIVGPGQVHESSIIPKLVHQIKNDLEIDLTPNGVRCYCHVDDCVKSIAKLLDNGCSGIYNIGNPNNKVSNTDLYEIIKDKINPSFNKLNILNSEYISCRIPDIKKLEPIYKPQINLNSIVDDLIK